MAAALSSSTPSVGTPRSRATWVCRPKPPETGPARAAASPTSRQGTEDAELEANALGQQMRSWVEDAGGYIHPALALSCATPNGRGIVAVEGISLDTAEQQPLIAVPESLLLTTEAADAQLGPRLWQRRLQRPAQRQPQSWWPPGGRQQQQQQRQRLQEGPPEPTLLLALLLAHERRQGSASRWWPYIAALPEEPPCGWALGQQQLNASLEVLGGLAQGWAPQVAAASSAVGQRAEAAAAAYGAELGLSAGDVRWALGHVVSRCFGSGAELALLPFVDLCNHRQHAAQPDGYISGEDEPCAAVYSCMQGAPQALPAGAELCISYVAGTAPLNMFLNFGFVPEEHRAK